MIGLLAGISAGILFAPKSGKKLRAELMASDEKFTSFGKALVAAAKDVGGEVQSAIDSKEISALIAAGKKSADDLLTLLEEKSAAFSEKAKQQFDNVLGMAIQKADITVDEAKATAKTAAKKATRKINAQVKQVKKVTLKATKKVAKKITKK